MTYEELFNLLEKTLKYTPIVYKQSLFTTNQSNFDNNFKIEYKYTEVPDDCMLFFVPSVSSKEGNCHLIISVPQKIGSTATNYTYSNDEYDIVVEQNDGTTRPAGKGDIIAFRMCFFRFRKTARQVILCNSPLYNSATFSRLKVSNCEFVNPPTIKDPDNADLEYTFVSTKDLQALIARIEKLEGKIIYGSSDPEDVLADKPAGTIYIMHEED